MLEMLHKFDASTVVLALSLATTWIATAAATLRNLRSMITAHEHADERRHRQNLQRFTWIASSLARMGNTTDIPTFDE